MTYLVKLVDNKLFTISNWLKDISQRRLLGDL